MALPAFSGRDVRAACGAGMGVKPLAGGAHGRCPWPSAISPARMLRRTDIWRTGKIITEAIGRIIAGQGPVVRIGDAVCKTVGSAYASSNLAPATTSLNSPWPACMRSGADLVEVRRCPAKPGRMRVAAENMRRSFRGWPKPYGQYGDRLELVMADPRLVDSTPMQERRAWRLWVPETSSRSCDKAIFVNQATDTSLL
jgi:hypothetical protein